LFLSNVTQNVRTTVNYDCQDPLVGLKTFLKSDVILTVHHR